MSTAYFKHHANPKFPKPYYKQHPFFIGKSGVFDTRNARVACSDSDFDFTRNFLGGVRLGQNFPSTPKIHGKSVSTSVFLRVWFFVDFF